MKSWPIACVGVASGALVSQGCGSPLPGKGQTADSRGAALPGAQADLALGFEPAASLDTVSSITRIVIRSSEPFGAPRTLLVKDGLTVTQLRDLARPSVPSSLSSRAVAALVWVTGDSTTLVAAPLGPLDPGGAYTFALSDPLASFPFAVEPSASVSFVARVWPDPDEAAPSAHVAVWCGGDEIGTIDAAVTLEPGMLSGRFVRGTGGDVSAPRCVSWVAHDLSGATEAHPVMSPPRITLDDGSSLALEPVVLFSRDAPPAAPASCVAPEIAFGPACADVQDDRIVVRSPDDAILWTVDLDSGSLVRSTRGGDAFTLRPLPVKGHLRADALDASGRIDAIDLAIAPASRRPHVVLNEVMANPAGAEPAQEWVELYNDGEDAVPLSGLVLEDTGGRTVLPDVSLGSGAFALVVAAAYVENDGADPPPAAGTLIVRVPMLGRGGLSNDGEKLTLRSPDGAIVSTFPAMKTKNGVSMVRLSPDAPDGALASFAPSPNGTATPGATNAPP